MSRSWRLSPGSSARCGQVALVVPALAGLLLVGAVPAVAEPASPSPSSSPTAPPPPTPSAQPAPPTRADLDAARAAEAEALRQTEELQSRFEKASAALRAVQAEVSQAAADYARAVAELDRVSTAADVASAKAATTKRAAEAADVVVRQDAAAAYMQGAGPMHDWAVYLSANGVQDFMNLHADIDAIGSVHQGHLRDAALTASAAETDRTVADGARARQARATGAVKATFVAAQQKVTEASEVAARVESQQEEMVAALAAAHQSTVEVEQARQDALVSTAKGAGAGAGRAPGSLPLVGSGGSAGLTADQLDPRSLAREMLGPSSDTLQWGCLDRLWNAESGWRWSAANPSSGAYGIPQSLPGSKMAAAGEDWLVNPRTQIAWGLDYISSRYGTPCQAWGAFQARSPHWY